MLITLLTTAFTWYSLADFGLELNAARVTVDLAFNIQVIYCIGRDEKGGEAKNEGSNGETLCHFYLQSLLVFEEVCMDEYCFYREDERRNKLVSCGGGY